MLLTLGPDHVPQCWASFLFGYRVVHFEGKLMRYCEQAQRYGETFYRLYILLLIPNCYTNIVHVLLVADLKQAVIHYE